ncbi:MAG: isocitrate lyase/phosphoenolpyruvate mutase family protein [Candidatus Rokubacteria bacterium]|nr:isocitrate lyase/phosphoenolpyruvate mutase family protein [Candidatus Rokubacteria bacterium]
MAQRAKAKRFLELHTSGRLLLLPNAWDAGSARIFEHAGFQALGTTSAGVALSLGYPDGERVSRAEMLEAVRSIASAVAIPVTADLEAGYGPAVSHAVETARGAMATGAVGMNFEDSTSEDRLVDVAAQVERIRAIKREADAQGIAFVLNARTDVFLLGVGEPAGRFDEAVRRANAYRQAGADCLFVPGVSDAETIGRLVRALAGPLNVLAVPGTPPVAELERLGVARVSVGSGPMRATLALTQRIAQELRERGTYTGFTENTPPLRHFNRLFERSGELGPG